MGSYNFVKWVSELQFNTIYVDKYSPVAACHAKQLIFTELIPS